MIPFYKVFGIYFLLKYYYHPGVNPLSADLIIEIDILSQIVFLEKVLTSLNCWKFELQNTSFLVYNCCIKTTPYHAYIHSYALSHFKETDHDIRNDDVVVDVVVQPNYLKN